MTFMRKSGGFTLIELLVVIAIIALLVSILLPSLNQAKDLAKMAVCKSNMRTIASSCLLYADSFSGQLPPGNFYNYPFASWYNKDAAVGLLLESNFDLNRAAFYCPLGRWKLVNGYWGIAGSYCNTGYFYFGNYAGDRWPQKWSITTDKDIAGNFITYPTDINTALSSYKLFQDEVYMNGTDATGNHTNPNSAFVDTSVQSDSMDNLDAHTRSASYIPLW